MGALPHIAGDGAAGNAVVGVPDAVLGELAHIQPLAEPGGGGVNAGLVAQGLDFLAEGNGAFGAVGDAQTVGAAIARAGSLGIKVDGVVQLAAIQHVDTGLCFFAGLGLVDGLAEAVNAHPQTIVAGIGEMLLEFGVLHQRAGAVAAVADADDDELDTGILDRRPVDVGLVFGHVDAKCDLLLDAGSVKVAELIINTLDARDRGMGVGVVIIGLAVVSAPTGILRLLGLAEEQLPQPLQQAVLTGQAGGFHAFLVQRTGVQCGADLFWGQQDGAIDILDLGICQGVFAVFRGGGGLGGLAFCRGGGIRFRLCFFHRSSQRVFCGQFLRLGQEMGEGVLVFQLRSISGHGIGGDGFFFSGLRNGLRRSSFLRDSGSSRLSDSLRRSGGFCGRILHFGSRLRYNRSCRFFAGRRSGGVGLGQGEFEFPLLCGGFHRQARRLGGQQEGGACTAHGNGSCHDQSSHCLTDAAAAAAFEILFECWFHAACSIYFDAILYNSQILFSLLQYTPTPGLRQSGLCVPVPREGGPMQEKKLAPR